MREKDSIKFLEKKRKDISKLLLMHKELLDSYYDTLESLT